MRELSEANLPEAVEIEGASFPEDEAASPENMRFRRATAGAFFLEGRLGKGVSGERNPTFEPTTSSIDVMLIVCPCSLFFPKGVHRFFRSGDAYSVPDPCPIFLGL